MQDPKDKNPHCVVIALRMRSLQVRAAGRAADTHGSEAGPVKDGCRTDQADECLGSIANTEEGVGTGPGEGRSLSEAEAAA